MYRTLHRFRGFRWRGSWILPCPESGSRGFRPEASSIEKPWSSGGCLAWGDGGRSFSAVAGAEHGTEERGHGSGEVRGKGARVPLKPWQQALVAAGSAVGALLDPARADLVGALGETTGGPAFRGLLERMKRSDEGRRILLERPRVMSEFVSHAWDLPPNTFGAAYARFMGTRNFSPDDRPPVRFLEQDEVAYVATRAREVHDFWHVLFNVPTSVLGELALKMVEFQHTLLPMCFLSVAGASWRLKPEQRELLFKHYFPWAVQAGKSCDDLICIYYEKYFAEDLEEVRKRWGIIPAPPRPNRKNV